MITRKEFIKEWVKALRSGKYEQGKEALRTEYSETEFRYCCLGVACDVAQKKGVMKRAFPEPNEYLGSTLSKLIGISKSGEFKESVVLDDGEFRSLVEMNDKGVPFSTIAQIIEEQIEKKNFVKP